MPEPSQPTPFEAESGQVRLSGECAGDGQRLVLLHGLTATRRYVVMGSRYLELHHRRLVAYDARGHGESSGAPSYGYTDLMDDLAAVLDSQGIERAALAGASMGAHTALAFALEHPGRTDAVIAITPAYTEPVGDDELDAWDRLADGLEHGGVDGFIEAWNPTMDERWRHTALLVTRQRLERHRDLGAVAEALRAVPRSSPFADVAALAQVEVPVLVVGSRDEADPSHPLAVAQAYAEALPRAELAVEEPGKSPLAWQGAQLSKAIAAFLERHS